MAFTYDITTDRGAVRLRLGDTYEPEGLFTDAEIDWLLSTAGTVAAAADLGLRVLLTRRPAVPAERLAAIRALLSMTGGDLPTVDIIFPASLPSDQGFTEPTT